ncbi:hypothetical protein A359_04570 [secondary endosymbiont of Ctenarytaina eucalypti]|uniref:Uncharacterized protein n=1 Tax=secondary endosymbiont of Ctenarytaina eucalypti TaxID=1199245 RepID=J3TXF1_9ENTR|nr:hypothetical protein A359_04570 [secondary endosymbiont of Ctenarytaina eucalypti]
MLLYSQQYRSKTAITSLLMKKLGFSHLMRVCIEILRFILNLMKLPLRWLNYDLFIQVEKKFLSE